MNQPLDTISDNALMSQVKNGDAEKMGILYKRYYQQLYRFIFHMTGQKELSEDMVQSIFLRMLKYPSGFKGFGEFKTWMYHIARNAVYDNYRKVNKNPALSSIENIVERISDEHDAADTVNRENELIMLEKAMVKLTDENRELLILCRFQELKYAEIARILNISEGAVKVRVHRALSQLKENYFNIENKSY
jgi:RNA polymerase sigma factor (sigma-70 family)